LVPFSYRVADDRVFANVEGLLALNDVLGYLSRIRSDRAKLAGMPAVVDCRKMTGTLSAKELRAIAAEVRGWSKARTPRIRCAFLVESDLHFGLVRMFEALSDGIALSISAFRDRVEAMKWLEHPSQG
jgi:hypothetical protein